MKKLSFIFHLLLVLLISFSLSAKEHKIPHAVGLYVTKQGQGFWKNNLRELFVRNGISIDEAYFPGIEKTMEEGPLEDLLPDNKELRDLVASIRDQLKRFFVGLEFGDHKFVINVNDIEFKAKWDYAGLTFAKPSKDFDELQNPHNIKIYLNIETSNFKIGAASARAKDLNHDILGEIGFDNFELFLSEESKPFRMSTPIRVFKDKEGKLDIKVETPETNIDELLMAYKFKSPIIFPKIEVKINNHVAKFKVSEIEKMIKKSQDHLLSSLQTQLQDWISKEAPALLTDSIRGKVREGLTETNLMFPPGAPNKDVDPFSWSISIDDIDFVGDNVHLGLAANVDDPSQASMAIPKGQTSSELPTLEGTQSVPHDLAFSLNQGFINRVLQLSNNRGYFGKMDLESGDSIKITKQPILKLTGDRPVLSLEIENEIPGLKSVFVRNPIRVSFDLFVDFPIGENGLPAMTVAGVDVSSIHIDKKYIRAFASKVKEAAQKEFISREASLKGTKLADELPIPTDLFGISMDMKKVVVDKAGHLLFLMNYNLDK